MLKTGVNLTSFKVDALVPTSKEKFTSLLKLIMMIQLCHSDGPNFRLQSRKCKRKEMMLLTPAKGKIVALHSFPQIQRYRNPAPRRTPILKKMFRMNLINHDLINYLLPKQL